MRELERQYTYKEAAAALRVSVSLVRKLVARGRKDHKCGLHPTYRISHKVLLIPASSLARFLEGHQL